MRIEPHELHLHCMPPHTMRGLPSSMHILTAWRISWQERSARWGGALQRRLMPAVDGGCIATRCGSALKRALSVWRACVCVCVVWPVNNDCARVPWPEPMIFTFIHAHASRYTRSHAHHLTNRSPRAARPVRTRSRPRHIWVVSENEWLQSSVGSGRVGQSIRFAPGAPE